MIKLVSAFGLLQLLKFEWKLFLWAHQLILLLAVGALGPVGEHHLESESILSKDCSEHEINGVYTAFEKKVYDDLRSPSLFIIHYLALTYTSSLTLNWNHFLFSITLLLLNHQWNQFLLQFINTSEGMTWGFSVVISRGLHLVFPLHWNNIFTTSCRDTDRINPFIFCHF